jgi:hypothetical protein
VQLIRWTEIRGAFRIPPYADEFGMGFTTSIVDHHCHGDGRFPITRICGDCNRADGEAKRELRLPTDWSYSPEELSLFVTAYPHSGETIIDFQMAYGLYLSGSAPELSYHLA